MKRILSFLIPVLLFLSSCSLVKPSTPSVDVVQTSVALTLTAYPSRTPNLVSPTPLASTPTTGEATPTNPLLTPTYAPPPVVPPPPAPVVWSPAYADQFVRYYYQHINAHDYITTWSLLTDSFKFAVNGPAEGGYGGYLDFWYTVNRVDIQNVTVTSLVGNFAVAVVDMVYNYASGSVVSSRQTFHLFYNSSRGTWMFDASSGTVPTAAPYPYTPDQFIYYYFNNINLRNYGLTWSLLSDSFKARNNPDGYTGYVNFWDSVARVDITYVTINSQSSGFADVTAGMIFNYTSSLVTSANQLFHLIYNSGIASWQFNSP